MEFRFDAMLCFIVLSWVTKILMRDITLNVDSGRTFPAFALHQ